MDSGTALPRPEEVLNWIKGVDDGVTRDQLNMPLANQRWFVVSTAFLSKWKSGEAEFTIDNSELIQDSQDLLTLQNELILKPGLSLGKDFEIIPPKAWNYFKGIFAASLPIKRRSVQVNDEETQVQVSLKPMRLLIINPKGHLLFDQARTMYISHRASVEEAIQKLIEIMVQRSYLPSTISSMQIKLFKVNIDRTLKDIRELEPFVDAPIPAKELSPNDSLTLANIADEDLVVACIKGAQGWGACEATALQPFKCERCNTKQKYGVACKCEKFKYCSSTCKAKDARHVCSYSSYAAQSYSAPKMSSTSIHGLAGLQNLGNTCFMNSGLQCLSNTFVLTQNLITDAYKADLNVQNPLGTGGKLVEEFSNLMKELWYGSSRVVSPWRFKNALGGFAKQFSGYHQQDSQEMLSYLMDGIHEDLNRVKNKPYIGELSLDGISEDEMAARFWEAHLARNQSIIVDNMHGQYRSQVICPLCGRKSITFDPYLMVTLQIPAKEKTTVDAILMPASWSAPGYRLKVVVNKGKTVSSIVEEISRISGLSSILLASVSSTSYFEKIYSDGDSLQKYSSLLAYELTPLLADEVRVILEIFKEPQYAYYSTPQKSPLAYPRLLSCSRSWTLEQLYREVFRLFFEDESFDQKFRQRNRNLFQLNFVNPNKKKYSYMTPSAPCDFCANLKCTNCEVPLTEEPLSKYLRVDTLKLEVVFAKEFHPSANLIKVETHNSYNQVIQMAHQHKHTPVSMEECLQATTSPEQLDKDNTTYCSSCKDHVQGIKKMELYKLPRILIFHIKRFKQSGFFSSRNNKVVEFPISGLDMGPFCLTQGGLYDLYAVSNHYGSLSGGHYTAYAKNARDQRWYDFDDSSVSQLHDARRIVGEAAYVLFYERREQE